MTVLGVATHLWYEGDALAAAERYASLLPDSAVGAVHRAPPGTPGIPADGVLQVELTLAGHPYVLLNGGPAIRLTPGVSIFVSVDGQAEVDRLWDALLAGGGTPSQCGWLTDRWGLSWQIVPTRLGELLGSPAAAAVMAAMLTMSKIDVAALEAAASDG